MSLTFRLLFPLPLIKDFYINGQITHFWNPITPGGGGLNAVDGMSLDHIIIQNIHIKRCISKILSLVELGF